MRNISLKHLGDAENVPRWCVTIVDALYAEEQKHLELMPWYKMMDVSRPVLDVCSPVYIGIRDKLNEYYRES